MDDRIDLPGLESVKWGLHPLVIYGLLFGFLPVWLTIPLWNAIKCHSAAEFSQSFGLFLLTAVGIPAGCIVAVLWSGTQWETCAEGVGVRGTFNSDFVRWADVRSVHPLDARRCVLFTDTQSLIVRLDDTRLLGSVWQHLRRYGLEKQLPLREGMETLWEPITDDAPTQLTWENPRRAWGWPCYIALGIIYAAFASIFIYSLMHDHISSWLAPLSWLVLLIQWPLQRHLRTARSITVTPDRLIVKTARGPKSLPWEKIRSAVWKGRMVNLGLGMGEIYIPWNPADAVSTQLILAISRRLRTQPRAVLLPVKLQSVG